MSEKEKKDKKVLVDVRDLTVQFGSRKNPFTAVDKASVVSFVLDSYKPDEVGKALNAEGIAVRSGHHCAQPILRRFGLEATVRPSMAFYNTFAEVDLLVTVINRLARYHH